MIRIQNLSKAFENVQALKNISLAIRAGELCGLLGPNGAGKSTLLKLIMGLLEPDVGEIEIAEKKITFGEVEYKNQIGYAPENPVFYEYLTGKEFLNFIAAAKRIPNNSRQEQIEKWLAFFELESKAEELIKNYSHGMRRKLSLSTALLGEPKILILDEATNGLDPESSFRLKEYLRGYSAKGGTIIFSSHIIETIEHLCDRIIILHKGNVVREMHKQEWHALREEGSSLEQLFIEIVKSKKKN